MEYEAPSSSSDPPGSLILDISDSTPLKKITLEENSEVHSTTDPTAEGYLLWAKVKGFSYWPGVITVDPFEGITHKNIDQKDGNKKRKFHVHFLAYDNLRAWTPESSTLPYEGYDKFVILASNSPSKKKKDFNPGKRFQSLFDKAVKEAEDVRKIPVEKRLEKLGFVYVLIDEKKQSYEDNSPKKKTKMTPEHSMNNVIRYSPREAKSLTYNIDSEVYDFKEELEDKTISENELVKDWTPKLGELVWGHMEGFPYWPSFVTKSPDGSFFKDGFCHVQFFNWNNESGWVTKIFPWCSIMEYRKKAKTALLKDSSRAVEWNPLGKMLHKWKNAVSEAQGTENLSRKTRYSRYLVLYNEAAKRNKLPIIKRPKLSSNFEKNENISKIPSGWKLKYSSGGILEYVDPSGNSFHSLRSAISECFEKNSIRPRKRRYSERSWNTKLLPGPACSKLDRIRSETPFRINLDYLNLDESKSYRKTYKGWIKLMKNNKSVLNQNDSKKHSIEPLKTGCSVLHSLISILMNRKSPKSVIVFPGMDYSGDPDLFKLSLTQTVEIVPLPVIFLDHPTVVVCVNDNEEIITDVITNEFVAKKIIYN